MLRTYAELLRPFTNRSVGSEEELNVEARLIREYGEVY